MGVELREGAVIEGRYRLESPLGEGGYGAVWKAIQLNVNRPVAIKFLKTFVADPSATRRFEREAKALGRLQHPNCVTLLDFGIGDAGSYLVTEFLDGEQLDHWAEGDHDLTSVLEIAAQVLAALHHAHQQRIVHRDLKPANIVIMSTPEGGTVAKVLDFGIASVVGAKRGDITKTGEVFGTPGYMSPEQLLGENNVGPTADLYSFGVVLYQVLEGKRLFSAGSGIEIALKHLTHDAPEIGDRFPPALRDIVRRLLQKQPADRFQSAEEVARALARIDPASQPVASSDASAVVAGQTPRFPEPHTPQYDFNTPPPAADGALRYGPRDQSPPAWAAPRPPGGTEHAAQNSNRTLILVALGLVMAVAGLAAYLVQMANDADDSPIVPARRRALPSVVRGQQVEVESPAAATDPAQPVVPAPAATASPGCGAPIDGRGLRSISTMLDVLQQGSTTVFIPAGYDPDVAHPVLLAMHDTMQTPAELLTELDLGAMADRDGVVIVLPRETSFPFPWKNAASWHSAREELAVARDVLCLDAKRVTLYGHGSGGHAAQKLACLIPDVRAVVFSAYRKLEDDEVCQHPDTAHLLLTPTRDGRDPISGGAGCMGGDVVVTLQEHEEYYQRMYQCEGPRRATHHGSSTCYTWDCANTFESCHVDGGRPFPGQHARMSDCEGEAADFPYGEKIWEFLIDAIRTPDADSVGETDQGH